MEYRVLIFGPNKTAERAEMLDSTIFIVLFQYFEKEQRREV